MISDVGHLSILFNTVIMGSLSAFSSFKTFRLVSACISACADDTSIKCRRMSA